MSYYKPVTTISSIGTISQPIPVTIASATEPTTRENGGDLRQGDNWYDTVTGDYYTYIDGQWKNTAVATPLTPATTSTLGGVIVGTGLLVDTDGTLSVNPDVNIEQTFLNFDGPDTTQAIRATGAVGKKFSIRIGETTSNSSIVATFEEGKLTLPNGTLSSNTVNVTTITGTRAGVIWKLSAGDGMQFDNQPSGHIGGTPGVVAPGDAYNVGYGTISVGPSVLRATDTQTIVGDLVVEKAPTGVNPTRTGTIKTEGIKLTSPNGTEYLITVNDSGDLVSSAI